MVLYKMPVIVGTTAKDMLTGTDGNDIIYSLGGNDTITDTIGDDNVYGWMGNDHLNSISGNDFLSGGKGDDEFRFTNTTGNITIRGGEGYNFLYVNPDVFAPGEYDFLMSHADNMHHVLLDLADGGILDMQGVEAVITIGD
jgi:Ca2+-binding RTX toxin-like protein